MAPTVGGVGSDNGEHALESNLCPFGRFGINNDPIGLFASHE
jgi:hypothetical protein